LLSGHKDDVVNRTRHAIYQACLAAAQGPPGLYRLTVPTGGGKTRSALAFALQHAIEHGMERIIVAVPYLSITEQTVRNYREILERDGIPVVLEHHSGVANNDDEERANWMRLGAENWDAPVIVTTTVQLFDSLFANRPQALRKVHRLANAVIVLDEAQSLPPGCLAPILDVLQRLPTYNTTVVLSTATQPAFEAIPGFQALEAREIIPQPEAHFGALERVRYDWRLDAPTSWDGIVDEMLGEEQAMVIVNTRRDAQELYAKVAARDPSTLHLSAAMCGLHKRRVLEEVEHRLKEGRRCRLVSTQVVEAGVDLDFRLVLRALGPLDAIIQAAGRCNREGKLERGRVVVFEPAEGGLPPGVYQIAAGLARATLGAGIDPNSPQAAEPYYRRLFQTVDADANEIQPCRRRLDYAETARRFHLIDGASESVIVAYGTQDEQRDRERTIDALVERRGNARDHWRALQPYTVSLPRSQVERALREGLAAEAAPGLILWSGAYDRRMGLSMEPAGGEAWVY
jgi:CRISPR-associated endonuclease/helicase Cas3